MLKFFVFFESVRDDCSGFKEFDTRIEAEQFIADPAMNYPASDYKFSAVEGFRLKIHPIEIVKKVTLERAK